LTEEGSRTGEQSGGGGKVGYIIDRKEVKGDGMRRMRPQDTGHGLVKCGRNFVSFLLTWEHTKADNSWYRD
jgi:hypothetical protein